MLFELCTWLIVFLLLVCLVWVEPGDEFANEEPVEFAVEDHTLEITTIFALLDARSFALPMLRYLPLAYHASQIAMFSL